MTNTSDIRQTAAMVQISAETIANIHKISDQIAEIDRKIRACRDARMNKSFVCGSIDVLSTTGADKIMLLPPDCEMLLEIVEILHRRERAKHIDRLDEIGIVLTDQADLGPAPAWPSSANQRSV